MTHAPTETGKLLDNYVGGRRVAVESDDVLHVHDPATGEVLARVPLSTPADVERAVEAAKDAFETWSETPVMERARAMFRVQALYEQHFEELSELIVLENGKALQEARGELRRGIEVIEFAAGMPTLMMGGAVEQVSRGVDTELFRHPLGVVAAITPFNFPAMVPLWTAPIAVASGNTYILKPSQRTPLSAMRLVELFEEAGIPPGVVNVVHGAADAVNAICDHPSIRAVSFVGSAPVAKHVYARCAQAGKRVQALAGAKNHIVVMPDADLEMAAPGLFSSAFANAGQRCLAGSVGVAVGGIADALAERLVEIAKRSPMGPGLDPENTITPVTTDEARRKIAEYIDLGVEEGARLLVDGRIDGGDGGFFLGPTILDEVRPEMRVAQEEIFGPVLSMERLTSLEEALEVIKRNEFGNATAIFTRDGGVAREFRRKVTAGMVGINIPVPAAMAFFPFAGWKGSFYGDLHATGKDGVYFFTESKVVTTRWPRPAPG
jgi:malonate-semialdehyde dehydrogenase (acetylating)/methylmalonate-semialdehyde dehydrogenase